MNEEQQKQPLNSISADVSETNDRNRTTSSTFIKKIQQRFKEHSGMWYALSANIIFACCTFVLKLIPADVFDIMIVRFGLQSIVFGTYAVFYKHYNVFDTNGQPIACALNIFMSSLTNLTYLGALYFLPLSDLNTIKYTYIVWAAILSVMFLKDRFKFINGVSLCLTGIGLLFATKPHFFIKTFSHIFDPSLTIVSNITLTTTITTTTKATYITNAAATSRYYYLGVGIASLSAVAKALQMIARKQLVKTKQPYSVMNFQFTIVALFVSITYSVIRRFWQPGPYPWKWMGTVGIIFGCCQLLTNTFMAKALKRENVQLISVVGSLDIIYAVILQYIFLRQTKSWFFYLGASLIVSSAVILSIDRHIETKRQRKNKTINDKHNEI